MEQLLMGRRVEACKIRDAVHSKASGEGRVLGLRLRPVGVDIV